MTHVPYPGCYCADCVEGTPSARITGDKDRSVQSRAPTQRITIPTEANRQLAIECHRLRGVLRWIADTAYVDHQSGNQNFEYLQSVARDALSGSKHGDAKP